MKFRDPKFGTLNVHVICEKAVDIKTRFKI